MTMRYDGRVAVITGAGQGLGRSHALFLASRGAKVVVNDLGGSVDGTGGSASAAEQVVAEIKAAGGEAVANADSVATREGGANIVKAALDAFGSIDILVNNAGILRDKSFAKMSLDDFEAVVQVHLMGSVYCTHAAWPHMLEQQYGRIVFTTSTSGLFGNFGQANYSAAKIAVVGLMNTLKAEGQKSNIKVNCISPAARTRMTEDLLTPEVKERLVPEWATAAVAWMCAEDCTESGVTIHAGGGRYARVALVQGPVLDLSGGDPIPADALADSYGKLARMEPAKELAGGFDAMSDLLK